MNVSKRDLIIIALLVNLGVLSIIISLSTSKPTKIKEAPLVLPFPQEVKQEISSEQGDSVVASTAKQPVAFDEIDELLDEYLPQNSIPEESRPQPKPKVENKSIAKKASKPKVDIVKKTPVTPIAKSDQDHYYTVQSGDTPWTIAKKFHMSTAQLLELNNLNEKKAKNLKIGQQLKVSSGEKGAKDDS